MKNKIKNFFKSYFKEFFVVFRCFICHPKKFWQALSDQAKKWTLRGLVVLLIILIAVPVSFWLKSNKVSAAWWNDSWQYRKPIAVTNSSGGALTDFQVKILSNINLSTDITSGKIQSDLDDLRFTDINGNLLPYWIEDTTTTSVDVWAKLPSIPTSGATVYMYYGNSSASAVQNGENVFEFFDDFNYSDNNALSSAGWSISSYVTVSMQSGWVRVQPDGLADNLVGIKKSMNFGTDNLSGKRYEIRAKNSSNSWGPNTRVGNANPEGYSDGTYLQMQRSGANNLNIRYNGSIVETLSLATDFNNQNVFTSYALLSDQTHSGYYLNEATSETKSISESTIYNSYANDNVGLMVHRQSSSGSYVEWDWMRVRKYASADPSATSPSTEEKGIGPVAYWSFDEGYGTNTNDATTNNNDGTLTNMSSTASPTSGWQTEDKCISGKCLAFDGTNDYVQIPDSVSNSVAGDMTLSVWVKPTLLNSRHSILSKNYSNEFDLIAESNGGVAFYHGDNSWEGVTAFPAGTVAVDRWTHLQIVRTMSDKKMYFYANGKLVAGPTSFGKTPVESSSPIRIGYRNDNSYYFKGLIDEPKIYNYARSAAQIKMDYNAGLAGTGGQEGLSVSMGGKSQKWLTDGLVGYWKMDEASWNGTSGEVIDASGNGNNGTAASGVTTSVGKFGNGGNFTSSSQIVNVGNSSSLYLTEEATFSLWYKPTYSSCPARYLDILGRRGTGTNYELYQRTGTCALSFYNGGSITPFNYIPTINEWIHITVVSTSSNSKLYINGQYQDQMSLGLSTGAISDSTKIGSVIGGEYPEAKMDEVRIYSRALSPDEVSDLYSYAPGPVGHWKMDENAGTTVYDFSGNGKNGTLTNMDSSTDWVRGKYGGALDFDGSDDYVSVASGISTSGGITVGGWVNSGNFTDIDTMYILGSQSGAVGYHWLYLYNNSIHWQYAYTSSYRDKSHSYTFNPGEWHYIAVSHDYLLGEIKFYVDGVLKSTQSQGADVVVPVSNKTSAMGTYSGTSHIFKGKLDDIKIYNYARTPKQIKEDMLGRNNSSVSEKSTVGYWKFDEGYSTSAYDSSGNSNTGTITGATWSNSGKFGKAMSFNGTSSCVSHSNIQIGKVDSWSFSTWQYKPTGSGADWQGFIGKNMGTTDGGYWMWHGGALVWYQDYYDPGGGYQYYGYWNSQVNLGDEAPYDRWFNLLVTYNGSNYETKVYIDGVLRETKTATWSPRPVSQFTFYGIGCASGRYFNGLIDETKVYNYALTADEVTLDYNQGKSMQLGSSGTTAAGLPSNSEDRKYCPPGDTTASCGPIAEWKFDEMIGTNVYNTAGTNNGTLSGDPAWVTGKYNGGLRFDGSDDAMTIDTTNIGNTNWTVSTWIKTTSSGSILSNNSGGPVTNNLRVSSSGKIQYLNYDGNWQTHSGAITVNDGRWHLLTWVNFSNQTMNMYVDGVPETGNGFGSYVTNAGPVNSIGRSYESRFNGTIDHMKIYNYSLNQSQIAWDYNRGAPVGWWRMDEGEGITVYDHSGKANNGTMTNMDGATDWVSGKINKALDFDGSNDYVDCGNGSSLMNENSITLSAWIKTSSANEETGIATKGTGVSLAGVALRIRQGIVAFSARKKDNSGYWDLYTGTNVLDGTWHHVVGTFDSSGGMKKYIDGELDQSGSTGQAYLLSNVNMKIGTGGHGAGYFNGQIDDVRVYNYSLTAQQVKDIYNGSAINFK